MLFLYRHLIYQIYGCGIDEGHFCVIIEQVALNKSDLITQDFRVKHTNITTIYNEYENTNYLIKLLEMPRWGGFGIDT